jgi:chromosome segregation ATPase
MKHFLISVLEKVGLVTVGRHRALAAKLRDVESRVKALAAAEARASKLAVLVEELRAESSEWKAKRDEALKQAQTALKENAHQTQRLEKLRVDADKLRERLARARTSHEELTVLQARLGEAERELTLAREHLMAIEVKLDILEGAANVLDTRTRSVIAQRASKTGVAV